MEKLLILFFIGVSTIITEISSSTLSSLAAVPQTQNFSEEIKSVITEHIKLYQVLYNGFGKLKIEEANKTNVAAEAQEEVKNLITAYFQYMILIRNMTSLCTSNKKSYDYFRENCLDITPVNGFIEESSPVTKCFNVSREMIQDNSEKMLIIQTEMNEALKNMTSASDKVIVYTIRNNFNQTVENKLSELNVRIKDEADKVEDALPRWSAPWLDLKAAIKAKRNLIELEEQVIVLNDFLKVTKDYENLIQKIEHGLEKIFKHSARTLGSINKTLLSKRNRLHSAENLFNELNLDEDGQRRYFYDLRNSVSKIYETSCSIFNDKQN